MRVAYQLTVDRIGARTGVDFTINEGRQAVVSEIRIAGNDKTSERLVREQIVVKPAEPLNLQALSRSRKNLYDSGAFSIVDLSRDTISDTNRADAMVGALTGLEPTQKPVVVEVTVREVQPYQLRYGASYDTEGTARRRGRCCRCTTPWARRASSASAGATTRSFTRGGFT